MRQPVANGRHNLPAGAIGHEKLRVANRKPVLDSFGAEKARNSHRHQPGFPGGNVGDRGFGVLSEKNRDEASPRQIAVAEDIGQPIGGLPDIIERISMDLAIAPVVNESYPAVIVRRSTLPTGRPSIDSIALRDR